MQDLDGKDNWIYRMNSQMQTWIYVIVVISCDVCVEKDLDFKDVSSKQD